MSNHGVIGTFSCTTCAVCGTSGKTLYEGLKDVLFGAQGEWAIKKCANTNCGLLWLDPMPLADEIHKAYAAYPTHQDALERRGVLSRLYRHAQTGYRARRFGFLAT